MPKICSSGIDGILALQPYKFQKYSYRRLSLKILINAETKNCRETDTLNRN